MKEKNFIEDFDVPDDENFPETMFDEKNELEGKFSWSLKSLL